MAVQVAISFTESTRYMLDVLAEICKETGESRSHAAVRLMIQGRDAELSAPTKDEIIARLDRLEALLQQGITVSAPAQDEVVPDRQAEANAAVRAALFGG